MTADLPPPPLRFSAWPISSGTSLSAVLPPLHPLSGIYILRFANGEAYVGKSVNVVNRFASHARRWDDIERIEFCPVEAAGHTAAERDMIARVAASGVPLRNIDGIGLPLTSDALDRVVDREFQAEWLTGVPDNPHFGLRGEQARMRRRTAATYAALSARADYEELVDAAAAYVGSCLPWPQETERRFWSVTSLAGSGKRKDWRRLIVVNINSVEALVLGEVSEDDGQRHVGGFLNAAADTPIPADAAADWEPGSYVTTGPVRRLWLNAPSDVAWWLSHDDVLAGARRFALGLLRKGRGMQG